MGIYETCFYIVPGLHWAFLQWSCLIFLVHVSTIVTLILFLWLIVILWILSKSLYIVCIFYWFSNSLPLSLTFITLFFELIWWHFCFIQPLWTPSVRLVTMFQILLRFEWYLEPFHLWFNMIRFWDLLTVSYS